MIITQNVPICPKCSAGLLNRKQDKEILTKAFEKTALYKLFEMFDNDITIPEGDIAND